jgi:hypothetical protein
MLKYLNKRKKGQSTAEYAILIALVIAAVIAMQKFTQRALQGRMHDAAVYLANQTQDLGPTLQFEPDYLTTNFTVQRDTNQTTIQDATTVGMRENSTIGRLKDGYQAQDYSGPVNITP